ncbi:AMP-binding protein [Scleromatobacter humisilvae]|uniref:AMP-binding protein n=1 Tax=Scleromatobacter humisilvae TaxID=2897159 RepID=A0A9X1YLM1_9BURK|nr:AMP-binding protein [Scleromatobacter humisilvae]MCK9687160.1 AMP-binding protein [Scleromatobacter humisilvae]
MGSRYSELTFAGLVGNRASSHPDLDVLTIEGGGQRPDEVRTFAQLWDAGRRLGAGLRTLGLRQGDRFGLLMANHAEFVEAMVAAAMTGAVFVPIDPRTKDDRLARMLADANCVGVVAADYALGQVLAIRGRLANLKWIVGLSTAEGRSTCAQLEAQGAVSYARLAGTSPGSFELARVAAESPMQLIYTSGTTGDPKGIVMTHRRYCETAMLSSRVFGYWSDDRPYSGLSLTHANAQLVTLGASIAAGMRCVLSRRFTKSRLWDITRRYGCTSFSLLGGMTTAVYAEPPDDRDADNPVRFVVSAGMPQAIWNDFERRFGVQVLEFYDAAEGGLCVNPIGVGPIGSIGKAIPSLAYRVVDEQNQDVRRGEPGELLFRPADGSPSKVEYLGDPQASAKKTEGGWLRTGDVVIEDADGWLFFQHRQGGGIRCNGDFIDPAFVEKAIAECAGVDDVHVYGVPARSGVPGEKDPVAAVVPKDRAGFDAQGLFQACRRRLDANLVPRCIQVLEQIPKTASEKPQERLLIEAFEAQPHRVFTERPA